MNLYRISQSINDDYDTFDSAVVVAESESDARKIHPGGRIYEPWAKLGGTWAITPEDVEVELIGTTEEFEAGTVIVASFNAG